MQYSYNWLKELSGTKKFPAELAKLLMTHAFEVESIEQFSHGLDGVVVGHVTALAKHPNADKLRVATVAVDKNMLLEIVCGAPNVAVGHKVALALVGTKLPNGMDIQATDIRGVRSEGMICSVKELGLGSDHTGIVVLADDAPVGVPFAEYAGLADT